VKGEQFVKLPRSLLESPAWCGLGINARRFVDFLMLEHMRQGGRRNGFLLAPRRQLWDFGIGAHFVSGAIDEAEQAGLVDCWRGKGRRANLYALTWLPLADASAPTNRWAVMSAVSSYNECQTALTKPVVSAKQHSRTRPRPSRGRHPQHLICGFAIAPPNADDPPRNRTKQRKPESQIARKPAPNPRFLAKTITPDPRLRPAAQRLRGSSRTTQKLGQLGCGYGSRKPNRRWLSRPTATSLS
jgi:hypothetical protein